MCLVYEGNEGLVCSEEKERKKQQLRPPSLKLGIRVEDRVIPLENEVVSLYENW